MAKNVAASKKCARAKASTRRATPAKAGAAATNKSLFEQHDDDEIDKKTQQRRRRQRTVDEVVAKALRDNFPQFKNGQATMLLNSVGKSLTDVLREDREKIENGAADAPVLGKRYYDKLRADFSYSDSPFKRLKVKDTDEAINEDLLTALEDINKHPRCFENAHDFFEGAPLCNQKSLVLLFKQALKFNANANSDIVGFLVGIVKYCSRHRVHEAFKQEWVLLRQHLDEALVRSLAMWKASNMKTKLWWDSHRAWLGAIIPIEMTDKCMEVVDDYQKVESELCSVVQSSALGQRLFGAAHTQYQGSKISKLIDSLLSDLVKKPVTKGTIVACRQSFIKEASSRGREAKEPQPKRIVEISYRGAPVPIAVHSHYDEFLMREAALLEGLAVDNKLLKGLFCESELVDPSRPKVKVQIEDAVLEPAALARRAAKEAVVSESPSGDVILNAIDANASHFVQLHRGFRVQVAFWQSVVGAGAEKRLQSEILRCVTIPSGRQLTLDEAISNMEALGRGKLVAFCGLSLQAVFSSCQAFLADIKCNRSPKFDGENDSVLLKKVMDAASVFLSCEAAGEGGANIVHKGAAAAQALLTQLRAMVLQGESPALADLTKLKVFGWLLSPEEREEVSTMVDEAFKKDVVAAAAATSAASGAGEKSKKNGRKKVAPNAREAVLGLLA